MDYICAYCGTPHTSIEDRMKCEKTCHDEKIKEEEMEKESMRNEEMQKEFDGITSLLEKRDNLNVEIHDKYDAFNKKYHGAGSSYFYNFLGSPLDKSLGWMLSL